MTMRRVYLSFMCAAAIAAAACQQPAAPADAPKAAADTATAEARHPPGRR